MIDAAGERGSGGAGYLAEVGATETGGNKAAWIQDLFANLPLNPDQPSYQPELCLGWP